MIGAMPRTSFELLMSSLDVSVVDLGRGSAMSSAPLSAAPSEFASIHYCLSGRGSLELGQPSAVDLYPGRLIVVPPRRPICVRTAVSEERLAAVTVPKQAGCVGDAELCNSQSIKLISGRFRALYGGSLDLFAALSYPIAEQFDDGDAVGRRLELAVAEVEAQDVGSEAITRTLLKQVLVMLFRRAGRSGSSWIACLTPLNDPQIARAFAEMVANPGAPHTVQSLSRLAALSRSSFMARFHSALGCPPMVVLRQLRMRQAEGMLGSNLFSIEQIAYQVGYANRSSFARAYRQASSQATVRKA